MDHINNFGGVSLVQFMTKLHEGSARSTISDIAYLMMNPFMPSHIRLRLLHLVLMAKDTCYTHMILYLVFVYFPNFFQRYSNFERLTAN